MSINGQNIAKCHLSDQTLLAWSAPFLTSSGLVRFFRLTAPAALLDHLGAISLKNLTKLKEIRKLEKELIRLNVYEFSKSQRYQIVWNNPKFSRVQDQKCSCPLTTKKAYLFKNPTTNGAFFLAFKFQTTFSWMKIEHLRSLGFGSFFDDLGIISNTYITA